MGMQIPKLALQFLLVALGASAAWGLPSTPPESTPVEALRARAAALMQKQDWPAAAVAFAALVAAAPEDGQGWLNLGRSRQQVEDFRGAIAAYETTIAVGGQGGIALYQGARCWLKLDDKDMAIEWLGKLADAGSGGYRAVVGTPDFAELLSDPRFAATVERMRPCRDPEYRQFDFWLGEWEVTGPTGQPAGRNRITALYEGCTLREEWRSSTGSGGTSLSFYDSAKGVWHQTWIDDSGGALYMDGGWRSGSMVLESDSSKSPWHRVSWTPLEGGKVRQLWESSTDSGESWGVVFDGVYSPVTGVEVEADD